MSQKIIKEPMFTLDALLKHDYGTSDMHKIKSQLHSNAGRKPLYDYRKKIYPEIVHYIYMEGGDINNASSMAEEIYERCITRYGEKNTPSIDTLRTEYLRPILDRIKNDD